jgi:hypothetical protein
MKYNNLRLTTSLSGLTPVSRDVLGAGAGETTPRLPLLDLRITMGLSSGMATTEFGFMDPERFGGTGAFLFLPTELMELTDPFLLTDIGCDGSVG